MVVTPQPPPPPPPPRPPKRTTTTACDFCNDKAAVLYCRADTARLCLFCDHHVHSANLLSKKHLRSLICDNCGCQPVSVRCSTDNLCLCCDCDSDSHSSSSSAHLRSSVHSFSGCPSALELASLFGVSLDGNANKVERYASTSCYGSCDFDEFVVPGDAGDVALFRNALSDDGDGEIKSVALIGLDKDRRSPSGWCGKYKNVIRKQLVELFQRDLIDGFGSDSGGGGEGLVAKEGVFGNANGRFCVAAGGGGGCGQEVVLHHQPQQGTYTSLLMFQQQQGVFEPQVHLKPSGRVGGRDLIWQGDGGANANGSSTEVMRSWV